MSAHTNGAISASQAAQPMKERETVLLQEVLMPFEETYARKDVLLDGGLIAQIGDAGTLTTSGSIMNCRHRLLLPGFVNAHTHSIEHWAKGLIKPLPLELWVQQLIRNEPRGALGWHGDKSFLETPSEAVGISAMHCGIESLLSGCSAVLDHLFIRNMDDLAAAVQAYKAIGIRAFISPMLNDDAEMYTNYIPLVPDAGMRNKSSNGCDCCGMAADGKFRVEKSASDAKKTAECLQLWEEAVKRFHDPEGGIEIVIGPVTVYSASEELLRGAAALRQKYNLCGHTHLLETRSQALQARQWFASGSAVKQLQDTGFLHGRGTSLAHSIWLDPEEQKLCAEAGAVLVHNPLSNLRLGSGVAPLLDYARGGIRVAIGCDGSCSSDGQDVLEALKLASFLPRIATAEYRDWPSARQMALTNACKHGYHAIGMGDSGGELKEGMIADVTLWDLTSLALLPRTDPINLLVMGSRTQAPGAGSTLIDMWVRGVRVVQDGSPCGIDLLRFRTLLADAQHDYCDPESTDPSRSVETAAFETEYRAALQLDGTRSGAGEVFPENRVLYSSTLKPAEDRGYPNPQCSICLS